MKTNPKFRVPRLWSSELRVPSSELFATRSKPGTRNPEGGTKIADEN